MKTKPESIQRIPSFSHFSKLQQAPGDPILGVTEAFNADIRSEKVNLGVGIYYTEEGKIPIMRCVELAEKKYLELALPRGYIPINGLPKFNQETQWTVFGKESDAVQDGRIATFTTLGGTGALKVGADFLSLLSLDTPIYLSDPSWENHRALFETAGFQVHTYPYYDRTSGEIDFPGILKTIQSMPPCSIMLMHACCHNPTGLDLSMSQWEAIMEQVADRKIIVFFDLAYQGFGDGLVEDAQALRKFADAGLTFLVSNSFSKSFSLYGERVGALSIVTKNADECARVISQVKRVIRTNYSSPPTHGSSIVNMVLSSPELSQLWREELSGMRDRIKNLRQHFSEKLLGHLPGKDFSYLTRQKGMFSYFRMTPKQVDILREQYGIYILSNGRICIAALNIKNIDTVVRSVSEVIRQELN